MLPFFVVRRFINVQNPEWPAREEIHAPENPCPLSNPVQYTREVYLCIRLPATRKYMQQGALFHRHRRNLVPCLILYCTLGKCSRACLLDKWPAREEKCAARKTDSIIINLRGIRDLVGSTFYLTLGSESVILFVSDSEGQENTN